MQNRKELTEHPGYKIVKRMNIQKKIDALQKTKAKKALVPMKPKKQNVFTRYLRGTVPTQPKPIPNTSRTDREIMKLKKQLKSI